MKKEKIKYVVLIFVSVLSLSMARPPKEEPKKVEKEKVAEEKVVEKKAVEKKETETKIIEPIKPVKVKEIVAPILPEITPRTVIETKKNGEIDWGTGMLTATGKAAIDKKIENVAQARLMAERAATVVAQRNLLELIKEVRVTSETVVHNMMLESDVIISRVDGIVKGAKPVGKPKYDNDIVEVTLQVSLYAQNGIGEAVSLPKEAPTISEELTPAEEKEFMAFLNQYSGIVLDTRGTGFKATLFPKIYDENGNLVFDPQEYYNPNDPYLQRAIYYLKRLEEIANIPGVKDNPYVIKALKTLHGDIVISNEDAQGIRWLRSAFRKLVKAGKFIFTLL